MTRLHTVGAIAEAIGARIEGEAALTVARPAHPSEAAPEHLAIAMDAAHIALLREGRARSALLPEGTDWRALGLEAAILVERPRYALAGVTQAFEPAHDVAAGVHPTAVVTAGAVVAAGAAIGPFCVVGRGATVAEGVVLLSHVTVGEGSSVGSGTIVHTGARIGRDVRIGRRCIVQSNVVLGSDGFSYVTPRPGSVESVAATGRVAEDARNLRLVRICSLGGVEIGDDVEIGAGTAIDAGTVSATRIGAGTKIDNLVQIGHNVRIGSNCLICGQVGVAGSTAIGDRVVLGGQSGVADHVTIGSDVVAGARSAITANLPDRSVVLGSPALPREETLAIVMAMRRLPRLVETVRALKKRLSALEPNG